MNLSASGGPAGSTITITPQTVAAGDPSTNVRVLVQVPAASAAVRSAPAWAYAFALPLLAMLVVPFAVHRGHLSNKRRLFVLLLIALVSNGAIVACGGRASAPPVQTTSYTLTVTATSGSVSHSTTLTLIVR